jgi:hypothetical protein
VTAFHTIIDHPPINIWLRGEIFKKSNASLFVTNKTAAENPEICGKPGRKS